MDNNWSWKPDYNVREIVKTRKRKAKKTKKVLAAADKRIEVIKHFGLCDHASWSAIADMICQEIGRPIPNTKLGCKKLVLKYKKRQEKVLYKLRVPAAQFYQLQAWKDLRYIALKQSGGCCTLCGAKASDGVSLHVDHIVPRSVDPNKELDISNLQILCSDCNIGKSNRDSIDWRASIH